MVGVQFFRCCLCGSSRAYSEAKYHEFWQNEYLCADCAKNVPRCMCCERKYSRWVDRRTGRVWEPLNSKYGQPICGFCVSNGLVMNVTQLRAEMKKAVIFLARFLNLRFSESMLQFQKAAFPNGVNQAADAGQENTEEIDRMMMHAASGQSSCHQWRPLMPPASPASSFLQQGTSMLWNWWSGQFSRQQQQEQGSATLSKGSLKQEERWLLSGLSKHEITELLTYTEYVCQVIPLGFLKPWTADAYGNGCTVYGRCDMSFGSASGSVGPHLKRLLAQQFMPCLRVQSTMVHELTHAWIFLLKASTGTLKPKRVAEMEMFMPEGQHEEMVCNLAALSFSKTFAHNNNSNDNTHVSITTMSPPLLLAKYIIWKLNHSKCPTHQAYFARVQKLSLKNPFIDIARHIAYNTVFTF